MEEHLGYRYCAGGRDGEEEHFEGRVSFLLLNAPDEDCPLCFNYDGDPRGGIRGETFVAIVEYPRALDPCHRTSSHRRKNPFSKCRPTKLSPTPPPPLSPPNPIRTTTSQSHPTRPTVCLHLSLLVLSSSARLPIIRAITAILALWESQVQLNGEVLE